MKSDKYYNTIRDYFAPIGDKHLYAIIHQQLIEMPFKQIVTTNIDNCLYEAFRHSSIYEDTDSCIRIKPNLKPEELSGKKKIFHLHGRCGAGDEIKSIILASSEYLKGYKRESILRQFIKQCWVFHPCLFVGYSMNDPFLNKIIIEANELRKSFIKEMKSSGQPIEDEQDHYIFLTGDQSLHIEEQRINNNKLLIEAKRYKPSSDQLPKKLDMVEIHYRYNERFTALEHLIAQMHIVFRNIPKVTQ
jgi:hypothetical protein